MDDAPWIKETERTGHCRSGWFNNPPVLVDALVCDRCLDRICLGEEYYDMDGSCLCEECFDILTSKWRKRNV